MRKHVGILALLLAVVMVLTACGGDSGGSAVEPTGEVKEFTITASNFVFEPREIQVNQGDTVKITLDNTEGFHDVKINGYNLKVEEGKTLEFVADRSGEFDFICDIFCGEGHDDMKGILVVN